MSQNNYKRAILFIVAIIPDFFHSIGRNQKFSTCLNKKIETITYSAE